MEQYKVNNYFNEDAETLNDLISKFFLNYIDEVLTSQEYNDIISSDITLNL